ncbi:MAG: sulfur carrier protein ThiS [Burkholderiales bacterium]|nr:sulfur carrier protein ThiS [Burkholderiales bacterium]
MIAIELNGQPHNVEPHHNVQDLIDALSLTNQALAVAVDRSVVPRSKWTEVRFVGGEKVDIVKAIGGG